MSKRVSLFYYFALFFSLATFHQGHSDVKDNFNNAVKTSGASLAGSLLMLTYVEKVQCPKCTKIKEGCGSFIGCSSSSMWGMSALGSGLSFAQNLLSSSQLDGNNDVEFPDFGELTDGLDELEAGLESELGDFETPALDDLSTPDFGDIGDIGKELDALKNLDLSSVDPKNVTTEICKVTPSICQESCPDSEENCKNPQSTFKLPDPEETLTNLAKNLKSGNLKINDPSEFLENNAKALSKLDEALNHTNSAIHTVASNGPSGNTPGAANDALLSERNDQDSNDHSLLGGGEISKKAQELAAANLKGKKAEGFSLDLDFKDILKKFKKERKAKNKKENYMAKGGNIISKLTGKKLNVFERTTRALIGSSDDRDLLLERMEMIRKRSLLPKELSKKVASRSISQLKAQESEKSSAKTEKLHILSNSD